SSRPAVPFVPCHVAKPPHSTRGISVLRQDLSRPAKTAAKSLVKGDTPHPPSMRPPAQIHLPFGSPSELLVAPQEMPKQDPLSARPCRSRSQHRGRRAQEF